LLARFEVRGSRFEEQRGGGVWAVVRKWWRGRRVHRALGWKFWAVISGGATLPRELEAFWSGLGVALIQGYGMTETTALVTLNHPFHIKQGTIGKTLPGREVKIGADGEILVRGDVVAGATWERGAMRRREGEWLATGDLAETGAEGELKFVGRKGDAIVTGAGMNVHPADLEAALAGQAGVRGCVVVGCGFSSGSEAVAVVLFSGTEAELAAAVKEANRGLAEYQQIRRWVRWPELTFPYTSTGKLIRRKVAEWVSGAMGVKSAASDRNATGKATTEILSVAQNDGANISAAGHGVVGVIEEVTGEAVTGDSLRLGEDLKLDSLGRVQLQSALEQRFDVELEEDAMAAVETVGELRRMVEEQVVGGQLAEVRSKAVDGGRGAEGKEGRPQGLKPADFGVSIGTAEAVPLSKTGSAAGLEAEALARSPAKAGEEMVYPRWAWWRWVRWMRVVWIEAVMRPLVWVLARPRVMYVTGEGTNMEGADGLVTGEGTNAGIVSGAQNDEQERGTNTGILSGAQNDELNDDEPFLIICNHVTAFDGALVLYALPGRVRRRVACAMSGEMLMDYRRARGQGNWVLNVLAPGAYWLLTALFNVFPLPRARGFRRSFAHAGEAMDRGYSVLVFPEGSRSRDGRMHGFRPGIGLLAKEAGAAILPVGLRGLYELTGAEEPRRRWFHAGKIEVVVGAVVGAADEASDPAEVTARLEAAVRGLVEKPW
jgi:long-chain acyl-CoA synthetase